MKITLTYGKKRYGTSDDETVRDYRATAIKRGREITLCVDFPMGELGKGVGDGAGMVQEASLTLSEEELALFSELLERASNNQEISESSFFGDDSEDYREQLRSIREWLSLHPEKNFFDALKAIR
ncbi:hypothetical protein [Novilysobacter arseniciresistens]|uniref:hypothetical protein n=1 Tax=Novilysobacter arseniciresistens TaxID=1385522 RepID=UPI00126A446C|nr:hypothetical protein [Lysobacter arseniciresistens]